MLTTILLTKKLSEYVVTKYNSNMNGIISFILSKIN